MLFIYMYIYMCVYIYIYTHTMLCKGLRKNVKIKKGWRNQKTKGNGSPEYEIEKVEQTR